MSRWVGGCRGGRSGGALQNAMRIATNVLENWSNLRENNIMWMTSYALSVDNINSLM